MLISHPILRIECRPLLQVVTPALSVSQWPLQKDQALACVLPWPPEVIVLVGTDRVGQPVDRAAKVAAPRLPIVASQNARFRTLAGWHRVVHTGDCLHHLLPPEFIAKMLGERPGMCRFRSRGFDS